MSVCKDECVCMYVCGWAGGCSGGGGGVFRQSASKGCKTTDGISVLSGAWKLKDEYNCLCLYPCTILWCQLRLYTTVVPSNSSSYLLAVASDLKMMLKHCLLPSCSEARPGDSVTPCTPCCLPVPGTAGSPIFSVPPAPLSKINGAGGRWMEVQWVQTQWLSPDMPLCWHSISYLGKKKERKSSVCIHVHIWSSKFVFQCAAFTDMSVPRFVALNPVKCWGQTA